MTGGLIVFAYSQIGFACLEALVSRGERVAALFTHSDRSEEVCWFESCAGLARRYGLPVSLAVPGVEIEVEQTLRREKPDIIFSFYYRHMIPMHLLAMAPNGAFNMHGSLLPKYRGRAPVNWAVLHGETRTGVTLHEMTERCDAGDIIDQEEVPIGPEDTAGDVTMRLVPAAVSVLLRQIEALKAGTAPRRPQEETKASYFGGRTPQDGCIQWSASAQDIVNLVRSVAPPFPGAFSTFDNQYLMVWRAQACQGDGPPGHILSANPLVISAGKDAVEIKSFEWREDPLDRRQSGPGYPLSVGRLLGHPVS